MQILEVSALTPLRVEFEQRTFYIPQNRMGLSAKKCVLNLNICRIVCVKYYTHKSRGSYIMNESNSEVAEITPSDKSIHEKYICIVCPIWAVLQSGVQSFLIASKIQT